MLAIPVATLSRVVAESSSVAVTNGSRPTVSGIHNVGNPSASSWPARRWASADGTVSSTPVQIPTLPMSIDRKLSSPLVETRRIGQLEVSVVGLGCNNFGGRIDLVATQAVVDAALDAGINFFDTAD